MSKPNDDMAPPLFKTWPRAYAFVVFFLAAQVILFHLFTKAFE